MSTYDANRQLATRTDPNGSTIIYTYDELNRLIQRQMPGDLVSYSYDIVGRLISASDADASLSFTYDTAGRLTDVSSTTGMVSYSYDLNGNRITMTDHEGGITDYFYDDMNRLTDITNPSTETVSFTYDALSRRIETLLPNGGISTYTYDDASRLLSLVNQINAQPVSNFGYTYDNVGNRITMTDKDGLHNYGYDNIYRLLSSTHPQPENPAESFTYDPVGNRLTDSQATDWSYNDNNQLTGYDGVSYTHDNNGNMISRTDAAGITYYTYDPENRLTRIDFPDTTYVDYIYDPFGRRIQKNVNGTISQYLYDGEDILAEYDGTGAQVARYTHGPGIDEPLVMQRGGQSYYYHADGLGSITEITDATGNIVNSYVYNSFGTIVNETEGVANPYTYTARERDKESGLYFYRARYYDASIGRFLTPDPIGFEGGDVNLYVYVANNPIIFVDPYGLITIQNVTLVGAGASLVGTGALIITKAVPLLVTAGPAGVAGAAVVTVVGGAMIGGGLVITAAGAGYDPLNLFPDPNSGSQTSPCPDGTQQATQTSMPQTSRPYVPRASIPLQIDETYRGGH